MNVSRQVDPVQCRICGFEGPACTAAQCPRCRTDHGQGTENDAVPFTYATTPAEVLTAVADVANDQIHRIVVVRKVAPNLFHVGGLRKAVQVDIMMGVEVFDEVARNGDILFLSYGDGKHQLLRGDNLQSLQQAVSG